MSTTTIRQLNYVSFIRRACSSFIDMLIVIVPYCILSVPPSFIIFFIIFQFSFLNSRWQATLGKIIFDIKVVDMYGNRPAKKQILYRSVLILCFFLPLAKLSGKIFFGNILSEWASNFDSRYVHFLYTALDIIVGPLNIFSIYFLSSFFSRKWMLYDMLSKTYVVYDGSVYPSFIHENTQPIPPLDK